MRSILPDTVIQKRVTKNVMNLFADVVVFIAEILIRIPMTIGHHWMSNQGQFIFMVTILSNYGIMAALQILISQGVRSELIAITSSVSNDLNVRSRLMVKIVYHGVIKGMVTSLSNKFTRSK